jgi:hypothetical protein
MKGFTDVARFAAKSCGAEDLAIAEYPVAIGIQEPEKIRETVMVESLPAFGPSEPPKLNFMRWMRFPSDFNR